MMKILLAVDGSPYTKKMLAYLAAHDELLGNGARHAYTVITVQAALPPRARAALSKEMVDGYYAEEAAKVLDPVAKFMAQHGAAPATVAAIGSAGEEIAKYAEQGQFDLIVMGSHGRRGLEKLVLGSVAQRVLSGAALPVLVVHGKQAAAQA